MTIDMLPTIAALAGASLPSAKIDGLDIWPLVSGQPGGVSAHEALYFFWGKSLEAVRSGPWKLLLPHRYNHLDTVGRDGQPGKYVDREIGQSLFNLVDDPSETRDVAAEHPEVVQRLTALAEKAREDLGDQATKRAGKNVRPHGEL